MHKISSCTVAKNFHFKQLPQQVLQRFEMTSGGEAVFEQAFERMEDLAKDLVF